MSNPLSAVPASAPMYAPTLVTLRPARRLGGRELSPRHPIPARPPPPPPTEQTMPEHRPQRTPPPQPSTYWRLRRPPARLHRSCRRSARDGQGPGRPSRPPPSVRAGTHTHCRLVLRPQPADPLACFVRPACEKARPRTTDRRRQTGGQDRRQPQQPKQRPATPTGSRSNRGLGRNCDDEGGIPM